MSVRDLQGRIRVTDRPGRVDGAVTVQPAVALVIPALLLGGAERQIVALAKALVGSSRRVVLITFGAGDPVFESDLQASGVALRIVPKGRNLPLFLYRLNKVLKEERVGILHAYLTSAQAYAVILRKLGWHGALVFGIRDAMPRLYHRDPKNLLCDLLVYGRAAGAEAYIFNSIAGTRAKRLRAAPERVHVIGNFIDTQLFAPRVGARALVRDIIRAPDDALILGVIANFTHYKDYPSFFRAAEQVLQRMPNVHVISVGDFATKLGVEMQEWVAKSPVRNRMHLLGKRTDVERILPGVDALCSSSTTEGFTNVVAEAMACGVPCVVTDVGDSGAIVGDTGLVVQPGNVSMLAEALEAILSMQPLERKRLGDAARQRISELYSIRKLRDQYLAIYEEVSAV